MTMIDSLAISIPTLFTIFGLVIAWQNYKLNKKKAERQESNGIAEKVKEEEDREKNNEVRLIAIEKDVQYIRMSIDKFDIKLEDHEKRIIKLESKSGGDKK